MRSSAPAFFPPLKIRRGTHVCAVGSGQPLLEPLVDCSEGRLEPWLWLASGGVDGASGSDSI